MGFKVNLGEFSFDLSNKFFIGFIKKMLYRFEGLTLQWVFDSSN